MNKYNNNLPRDESPMRFNKRPRYGVNTSSGNNSPRFKQQNQTGYQYSQNRNSTTDIYKSNQYENTTNRNFYNSPKRSNYNQQNKQSPSSSKFPVAQQNVLNLTSKANTPAAQTRNVPTEGENNQHQQQKFTSNVMDSSNYYGYGFNFYAPYNADFFASTSNSTLGATDGMSPYMWQTITSTPPPKLPQQQLPPLPLQHPPPLPQQQPPSLLPPLPPPSDNAPHLPPPPPLPVSISDLPSAPNTSAKYQDQDSTEKTVIKMKAKRKAMSVRYKLSKSWSEKDALLALKAEETNTRKLQKDIILIIRFPDPEISREIVKCYSTAIESVHFQLNFAPRYCLVHLKPDADVEKTIDELSKIPFGTGNLSVEIKQIPHKTHSTKLNEVDPFTLYVGNLPTTIACKTLKEHFPGAARIDIGFAQRMKYTRYAFIRYQNVQQAIEAYKRMLDAEIGGRSLTIRFRRLTAATDGNKGAEVDNNDEIHDDILVPTPVALDDISKVSQNSCDDMELISNTDKTYNENNATDLPNANNKHAMETETNSDNNSLQKDVSAESNPNEVSVSLPSTNCIENETITQEKSGAQLNIKPDPDVDPDDIVIRNIAYTSGFEAAANNNIKQEDENSALYTEFFEKPDNQNDSCEKSNRSDINSLASTADETDTMSPLSSNSLGEFLQTCCRRQTQSINIDDLEPPSAKKNKASGYNSQITIKREPLDKHNIANNENMLFPNDCVGQGIVKPEADQSEQILNTVGYGNSSEQRICTNSNKKVPLRSEEDVATSSSKYPYKNATNNDDIVPPTALFLRNDYSNKKMLPNSTNVYDYDEFYETRVSGQAYTGLPGVKSELSETSTGRSTNEIKKAMKQNQIINRNRNVSSTTLANQRNNINLTTRPASDAIDDDDLVPQQNLLGSYRPLQNFIKRETEHDDIYSVPFSKKNLLREAVVSSENLASNLSSLSSNCAHTNEFSKSYSDEDNEDVVIISDNRKRPSIKPNSNNSVSSTLFISTQHDPGSFKHKPFGNRVTSDLLNQYDLDKLYEELDADSDGEL